MTYSTISNNAAQAYNRARLCNSLLSLVDTDTLETIHNSGLKIFIRDTGAGVFLCLTESGEIPSQEK